MEEPRDRLFAPPTDFRSVFTDPNRGLDRLGWALKGFATEALLYHTDRGRSRPTDRLGFFQKQRLEGGAGGVPSQCAKGDLASAGKPPSHPLLKDWFQARAARTSVDTPNAFKLKTTDRLQVSKAGVTTLINRTYMVVKHLGSGTYGQVKLAFNIRDKKLYAVKACKKSQMFLSQVHQTSRRERGLSRLRRRKFSKKESDRSSGNSISSLHPIQDPGAQRLSLDGCGSAKKTTIWFSNHLSMRDVGVYSSLSGEGQVKSGEEQVKVDEFVREIAIMKKLVHNNIVKLVEDVPV
eukprot:gene30160-35140_t